MKNMLRGILEELVKVGDDVLGLIYDFLKKLNADKTGEFLKQFKKFLREELVERISFYITHALTIMIDETIDIGELIRIGDFECTNNNFTSKKFPKVLDGQKKDRSIFIFHFRRKISSNEVISEMDKLGYKPANVWALVFLSIQMRDIQDEFTLIALGTKAMLDGRYYVTCLYEEGDGRELGIKEFDLKIGSEHIDWHKDYRFLAVRK
ncbi:MAG: hypothetical protein WC827_04835 [Candidatus Paceibacterota bacterium]|jgi:hypothetical protein